MPHRRLRSADRTPEAQLAESTVHAVVGYQLAQATIVTTQVFNATVGQPLQLRPVEYTMLALIEANPQVSARQLSRALAVTPPNVAAWLDRLVSRGLVQRQRSTSDARVQHLQATPAGLALVQRANALLSQGEAEALAALSTAERAMLVELLHKVALARRRSAG